MPTYKHKRHHAGKRHHACKRHHTGKRHHRGGGSNYPAPNPSSYSSGSTFVKASVGNGDQQFNNVFESAKNMFASNRIVGLQGQNMTQKAGGKRSSGKRSRGKRSHGKRSHSKSKRGGYWAQVVNQAVVPFSLWGMQHNYKKKR